MKTFLRLVLACFALSPALMAEALNKKPAPPVKKKAGPIIWNPPDLDEREVDRRMEELTQVTYGAATLEPLPGMEANGDAIESILQNKKAKTTLEKLNAPIVIRSMNGAAKYLSRASMEKIDIDFTKQQLVIFAWKGYRKDKLRGYYRYARRLDVRFRYSPANQPADQASVHPLSKKTFSDQGPTQSAVFATAKDAKLRVQQDPIRFEVIRCGL